MIEDVVSFFHSFNLSRLAVFGSAKDIVAKEEQMLAWAETNSLETAVQRRMYNIAKYREMILRKFLEARRQNLKAGQPTTAIDLQIIALLSDDHLLALETLQTQMRIHELKWERICSSRLFEGENRDRDAVIARSNTNNSMEKWQQRGVRDPEPAAWSSEVALPVCKFKIPDHLELVKILTDSSSISLISIQLSQDP
ncbi:Sec23/Sec24 protein transport family protein [Dorcoceras hygrometricum]|uniref:Sec23/Sec24 protein transport family protein n=1 Tax=Dorcoceras hygrometricum TaxID=472368 RepID=A0A2Z7BZW9_9LAMI|nr:Sec23/Sec24 protein transport family protein [Dorcoceras hygrometricum]